MVRSSASRWMREPAWPPAARAVFLEAWARYVRGFAEIGGAHQLGLMARHLYQTIVGRLQSRGFRRPGPMFRDAEHFEDYLLPMMHALMMAMPGPKEGEIAVGAFPDPSEPPAARPPRGRKAKRIRVRRG